MKMEKFAKLFDTEDLGQILVKIDSGENDGAEVRYFFTPPNMGVCSIAIGFKDNLSGWDSADKAFEKVDENSAREMIQDVLKAYGI
jgi:hypothetical protein